MDEDAEPLFDKPLPRRLVPRIGLTRRNPATNRHRRKDRRKNSASPIQAVTRFSHTGDIRSYFSTEHTTNVTFQLEGQVSALCRGGFILKDETGRILLHDQTGHHLEAGDFVKATAFVEVSEKGDIFPFCTHSEITAHGTPENRLVTSLGNLTKEDCDFREVHVKGTVIDSFKDELDDCWNWFRISDNQNELMLVLRDKTLPVERLDELLGSEIEAVGILIPRSNGTRTFRKPHLELMAGTDLKVIRNVGNDLFDTAEECHYLLQNPIGWDFDFLKQYRVTGTVVATWRSSHLCLRIGPGKIVRVQLRHGNALPKYGSHVTVVGFVRRRLFFSTIVNARCRVEGLDLEMESPVHIPTGTIFKTVSRNWSANAFYDGHLVTTTASVRNISNSGSADGHLLVSADGHDFTVQIGAMPPPPIGSTINVTGICLMTTEQDPNGMDFDRMSGIMIVPRSADDIRIISMPPWLTSGRLLGAVAALVVIIGVILVWTAHLKRVIAHRGRELADEQIQRAEAAFRVEERTRLAVEIHDSLSQTLSALSMQLGAIRRFADTNREKMFNRIDLATKALKSCRDELKNCLWDLRSDTLGEKDLDTAIRRTLAQHISDTMELKIRFNVPREKLTDSTTHTLLSIIRELVVNAIHHGSATTIRIAGALEDSNLKFSVSDNGCGFDTANTPGISNGHFGLQGIRERVENLGGFFTIDSSTGKGTRATVLIKLPRLTVENG